MKPIIKEMKTDEDILSTFPTVKQLLPNLIKHEYVKKLIDYKLAMVTILLLLLTIKK